MGFPPCLTVHVVGKENHPGLCCMYAGGLAPRAGEDGAAAGPGASKAYLAWKDILNRCDNDLRGVWAARGTTVTPLIRYCAVPAFCCSRPAVPLRTATLRFRRSTRWEMYLSTAIVLILLVLLTPTAESCPVTAFGAATAAAAAICRHAGRSASTRLPRRSRPLRPQNACTAGRSGEGRTGYRKGCKNVLTLIHLYRLCPPLEMIKRPRNVS
jgi:hypothetical protein